jgi:ribosomal protein S27AE
VPQKPDLRTWFADDELELCPRCGELNVLVTYTGAKICTECGLIGFGAVKAPPDPPSE